MGCSAVRRIVVEDDQLVVMQERNIWNVVAHGLHVKPGHVCALVAKFKLVRLPTKVADSRIYWSPLLSSNRAKSD